MHVDQYTLCYLKFEDINNPWKDECGNIFYENPDKSDPENLIYPQTSSLQHVNGRRSYLINSNAGIKCDAVNFNLNDYSEWTIDFWLYIPKTSESKVLSTGRRTSIKAYLFNINLYNEAVLLSLQDHLIAIPYISSIPIGTPLIEKDIFKLDEWMHIALVKTTKNFYSYCHGKRVETNIDITRVINNGIIGSSSNDASLIIEGYFDDADEYCDVYIDDFRISKIARYTTAEFDPAWELDHEFAVFRDLQPRVSPHSNTKRKVYKNLKSDIHRNVLRDIPVTIFSKYSNLIDVIDKQRNEKGLYSEIHRKIQINVSKDNKGLSFETNYNLLLDILNPDPKKNLKPNLKRFIEKTYDNIISLLEREIVYIKIEKTFSPTLRKVAIDITKGKHKVPNIPTKRKVILELSDSNTTNKLPRFEIKRKILVDLAKSNKYKLPKFETHRIPMVKKEIYFNIKAYIPYSINVKLEEKIIRRVVYKFTKKNPYLCPVYRDLFFSGPIRYRLIRVVQGDSELYNRDYNMGRNVVAFVFNPNYVLQDEYVNVPYAPDNI